MSGAATSHAECADDAEGELASVAGVALPGVALPGVALLGVALTGVALLGVVSLRVALLGVALSGAVALGPVRSIRLILPCASRHACTAPPVNRTLPTSTRSCAKSSRTSAICMLVLST